MIILISSILSNYLNYCTALIVVYSEEKACMSISDQPYTYLFTYTVTVP